MKKVKVFFATHTVTTGNNDRSILDVDVTFFNVAINNVYNEIGIAYVFEFVAAPETPFTPGRVPTDRIP